jgi:hypothetical protein
VARGALQGTLRHEFIARVINALVIYGNARSK